MAPGSPTPPTPVARAAVVLCALTAISIALGVLSLLAASSGSACVAFTILLTAATVPGLLRGHRGPRLLAVIMGLAAALAGSNACASAGSPGLPWALRIALLILGASMIILGASVVVLLTAPQQSRDWFRPSTHPRH
jgi:hypothetical protein